MSRGAGWGAGPDAQRTLVSRYERLVAESALARDEAQIAVAHALDELIAEIGGKRLAAKSSSLGWLFAKRRAPAPVQGLYVYGGVGRGKTMLMDMFFEAVPAQRKRRAHFNVFMADVHDRVQRHRAAFKQGKVKDADPLPAVAKALAEEAWVLCFDEFTVTDIADAMILSRLFENLFRAGVVLVATSNVAPDDLYRDGLNRGLFEPFIRILKANTRVLALDSPTDYRLIRAADLPVYASPLGPAADAAMEEAWHMVTQGKEARPDRIEVKGRQVAVPLAAGRNARFDFADICGRPLGARDYLALSARYDTIFVENIPVMREDRRNEAKRLILLVDTLYDRQLRLFASAEAAPDALYAGRAGTEAFEFARTASRLHEMQSAQWLEGWSRVPERAEN